jgi:putative chitinase
MITIELLRAMCPRTRSSILEGYVEPLNTVAEYYEMFDNVRRVAGFLAQLAHESGGFTATIENLNYSADGLRKTFPRYFPTLELAQQYARKPEKIANRVYSSRMKNGDEASGDGYKFRGRGLIQLTGRDNYTRFAEALEMSIEDTIAYLETPNGATASAGWFWDNNKLNQFCDRDDFITLTKRINGGTNGLEDRKHHYQIALKYLQG